MRATFAGLTLVLILSAGAAAQQETLIVRSDGAHVTVRTDESGTTVNAAKDGFANEPISPHEEAHWGRVYELTRDGGKIVSHRTEAAAR